MIRLDSVESFKYYTDDKTRDEKNKNVTGQNEFFPQKTDKNYLNNIIAHRFTLKYTQDIITENNYRLAKL